MIWCQEPFGLLKITEDSKALLFMGTVSTYTIILEIKMEKHLKYLRIYFKLKITLLYVSINNNFMKNNYFPRQINLVKRMILLVIFAGVFLNV